MKYILSEGERKDKKVVILELSFTIHTASQTIIALHYFLGLFVSSYFFFVFFSYLSITKTIEIDDDVEEVK